MTGWFVARTQTRRENWAAENIARQGAEFYLPRVAEEVYVRRGAPYVVRARCLFPSYIFVRSPNGQWRFLLGTFGVTELIMSGAQPAVVADGEIARIQAREDVDGIVHLPARPSRFVHGSQVRVADGPFVGYVGIYQGASSKECQRVLLDFLGRKATVLIGDSCLEEFSG